MMTIQLEIQQTKGRAVASHEGLEMGEMTFSIANSSLWIIDHTEVSESARGTGLGRKLLEAILDKARERYIKIIPLCPYVKSVFAKEPEIRDVLN